MNGFEAAGAVLLLALAAFVFIGWPLIQQAQRRQLGAAWVSLASEMGLAAAPDLSSVAERLGTALKHPRLFAALQGQEAGIEFFTCLATHQSRRSSGSGMTKEGTFSYVLHPAPEVFIKRDAERARAHAGLAAMPDFLVSLAPGLRRPVRLSEPLGDDFTVSGRAPAAIEQLLTPSLRSALLSADHTLSPQLRGIEHALLWELPDTPLEGEALRRHVEDVRSLCRALAQGTNAAVRTT